MRAYLKLCDLIVKCIEWAAGIMFLAMSASTCWQVISRYVLKKSSMWTQDLSLFLFVWIVLLGAAAAVYQGKHTAVTLIAAQFPKPFLAVIDYFAILAVLGCSLLITKTGCSYFLQNVGSKSSGLVISLGWPTAALPIGGTLMMLLSVGSLMKKLPAGKEEKK